MYPPKQIKLIEDLYDVDQESIRLFRLAKLTSLDLEKINLKNTDTLKQIIANHGFPFKDIASEKAYTATFLIVQHSGNINFMKKTIELFSNANRSQINKKDLGYLIDRLRICKNMPQLYGTQYKKVDDKIEFIPIEDIAGLEKRRAEMEMGSWDDYKKLISG